jgi:hypothetical protein
MQASLCFVGSAICAIAAASCFKANQPNRGAIDVSLGGAMNVPERVWPFYDAAYLNDFISVAAAKRTSLGKSVLELYIRPTLLWIDVGFAIFCAIFAALFWIAALAVAPDHPVVRRLLLFFIIMSVGYGISDVAEDLWLVRLFSKAGSVTAAEGFIASLFTQVKLVTISLSIVGGLLFTLCGKIFAKARS